MKTIILIQDKDSIEAFTTLTKACKKYSCFNYGYIKGLKFPFTYRGFGFKKIQLQ